MDGVKELIVGDTVVLSTENATLILRNDVRSRLNATVMAGLRNMLGILVEDPPTPRGELLRKAPGYASFSEKQIAALQPVKRDDCA